MQIFTGVQGIWSVKQESGSPLLASHLHGNG